MHNRQILWLGCLAILGTTVTIRPISAQELVTNNSDTSAGNTFSAPTVIIDGGNGNGNNATTQVDLGTGTISGGIIEVPIEFGSGSGSASASGGALGTGSSSGSGSSLGGSIAGDSGTPNGSGNIETGSSSGSGESNADGVATNPILDGELETKKISLNDAAEILENNLDQSYDKLLAAEKDSQLKNSYAAAEKKPVRVYRRRVSACPSPDVPIIQARQAKIREQQAQRIVKKQMAESQKFIEQVNNLDPENNIW